MNYTESYLLGHEPYSTILNWIWSGSGKAVSSKKLCDMTGLSDRALRKCIEIIRESGVCIVSDVNGYYRPQTEQELERYIRRMEKTARSYFHSLKSAKRALRRMREKNQMKLPE